MNHIKLLFNIISHKFIENKDLYVSVVCIFLLASTYSYLLKISLNLGLKYCALYFISVFGAYLFILSLSKKLFSTCAFGNLLISIIYIPLKSTYGGINFYLINSLYYTNTNEALSYLKIIPSDITTSLIFISFLTFFVIWNVSTIKISWSLRWFLAFCTCFPSAGLYNWSNNYLIPINELRAFRDTYPKVKEYHKQLQNGFNKKNKWDLIKKDQLIKKILVIVVDESVRSDMLHAYGFPIKNTPFIDNSNNILFLNYITEGAQTITSLLRTLAISNGLSYQANNNIVSLSQSLNLPFYWISNQGERGRHDTPLRMMANNATKKIYLRSIQKNKNNHVSDFKLIPYFKKALADNSGNAKIILLHRSGSHPRICDRVEDKYDEFIKTKEISCYNKSIKNLDAFLLEINNQLRSLKKPYNLIYFSDHGLTYNPRKKTMIHGYSKQSYQSPLLIWGSDINKKHEIKALRRGKDILHLICQILNIETKNIDKKFKFISEEPNGEMEVEVPDRWDGTNLVLYENLPSYPTSLLFD